MVNKNGKWAINEDVIIENVSNIFEYFNNSKNVSVEKWWNFLQNMKNVAGKNFISNEFFTSAELFKWKNNPSSLQGIIQSMNEQQKNFLASKLRASNDLAENRDYKIKTDKETGIITDISIGNHTAFNNDIYTLNNYNNLQKANNKYKMIEGIFEPHIARFLGGKILGRGKMDIIDGYLQELGIPALDGEFMGTGVKYEKMNVYKRPINFTRELKTKYENVDKKTKETTTSISTEEAEFTQWEYNPMYLGMLFGYHIGDFYLTNALQGDYSQYNDIADFFKRSMGMVAPGQTPLVDPQLGLPEEGRVVHFEDNAKQLYPELIEIFGKETSVNPTDGFSLMPALAREILYMSYGSEAGSMGTMAMDKFVYFHKDNKINLATYYKMANFHSTGDTISKSSFLESFEQSMMSPRLWAMLYELRQAMPYNEAIKQLARVVQEERAFNEINFMAIFRGSLKTGIRGMNPSMIGIDGIHTPQPFDTHVVNSMKFKHLRFQNNTEQDISDGPEGRIPKQIMAEMGILDQNADLAARMNDLQAQIASNGLAEFTQTFTDKDGTFNKGKFINYMRGLGVTQAEKMREVSQFAEFITNRNVSIDMPSLSIQLKQILINQLNSNIVRPMFDGGRYVQAPGWMFDIYDGPNGEILMRDEAMALGIDPNTKRELKPMGFTDDNGVDVLDISRNTGVPARQVFDTLKANGKLKVRPAEILISYSFVADFGVQGMTLNQARGHVATTMPQRLAEFEDTLKIIATRAPSSTTASGFMAKVVGFTQDAGSVVFTSSLKNIIDGSDYDIDQLTLYFKPAGHDT